MFVIELTYKVDLAEIDAHMAAHVAFLKKYYASGNFLVSGRKIPRDGGIILAVAKSRERIEAIILEDPFHERGLTRALAETNRSASILRPSRRTEKLSASLSEICAVTTSAISPRVSPSSPCRTTSNSVKGNSILVPMVVPLASSSPLFRHLIVTLSPQSTVATIFVLRAIEGIELSIVVPLLCTADAASPDSCGRESHRGPRRERAAWTCGDLYMSPDRTRR